MLDNATSTKISYASTLLIIYFAFPFQQQKHNVHDLQTAIKSNKEKYSESFRTLEAISEAIHISRSNKIWSMFPRMPGVGSETFSISSGLSELGLGLYQTLALPSPHLTVFSHPQFSNILFGQAVMKFGD